ncbi:MAG: energy transducer TonB [Bacteroidaceae bacterium]|nr:energy transducer TonB [Bacteroidaceae bacterium]
MLQSHLLYSRQWLNQIWANRNREYGAYQLRSEYPRRLSRALLWVYGMVLPLVIVPIAFDLIVHTAVRHSMSEIDQTVEMKPLDIEELEKMHRVSPGRQATAAAAPNAAGNEIAIVDSLPPVTAEVAKEGPLTMQVGETTIVRLVENNDSVLQIDSLAPVIEEEIKDVEILPGVPDFPGGYLALARWLDQHIEYPKAAIDGKIQGDVVVSVIIDHIGRVTNAQVTTSAHPLLDNAALEAVKKMPLWRWREDGTLHKARINIPVSFHSD